MDIQNQDNAQRSEGGTSGAVDQVTKQTDSTHIVQGEGARPDVAIGSSRQQESAGPDRCTANVGTEDAAPSAGDVLMDEVEKEKQNLPWAFIDCPTDDLVILIAHMLNRLMEHNDQVPLTTSHLTRFHSRAPPGISVLEYLRRIVRYTNLEKLPLLSLLAYIDTTCLSLPTFTLSSLTVHRFLISGVTAGSKALCDAFCTNAHYAKVGGIRVAELNALEREFLKITEWALCVPAELLQQYYSSLITSHGGYAQAEKPVESPFTSFPLPTHPPRDTDEDQPDQGMLGPIVGASTAGSTSGSAVPKTAQAHQSPVSGAPSDRSSSVATSTACSPGEAERNTENRGVEGDAMDVVDEASIARGHMSSKTSPIGISDRKAKFNAVASSSSPSPNQSRNPRTKDPLDQNRMDSSRSRSSRGSSRSGQSVTRGGQTQAGRRPAGFGPADRTASTSSFASVASQPGSSAAFHPKSEGRGAASPRVDTTPASGGSSGSLEPRRLSMVDSPQAVHSVPFPTTEGGAGSAEIVERGGAVGRRLRDSLTRNDSDERQYAMSLGNEKSVAGEDVKRARRKSEDTGGSGGGFGFMGGLFRPRGGGSRAQTGPPIIGDLAHREPAEATSTSMSMDIPERRGSLPQPQSTAGSTSAPRPLAELASAASPRRKPVVSSSLPHPGSVTPLIRSRAGEEGGSGDKEVKFVEPSGMDHGSKRTRRDVELAMSSASSSSRGDGMDIAVG